MGLNRLIHGTLYDSIRKKRKKIVYGQWNVLCNLLDYFLILATNKNKGSWRRKNNSMTKLLINMDDICLKALQFIQIIVMYKLKTKESSVL